MKKVMMLAAGLMIITSLGQAEEVNKHQNKKQVSAKKGNELDIDINADLLVKTPPKLQFKKINKKEAVGEVEKHANQLRLTKAQKNKVMAAVKKALKNKEVPPSQVMVCAVEKLQKHFRQGGDKDADKACGEIKKETKRVRNQIKEAKKELVKLQKKQQEKSEKKEQIKTQVQTKTKASELFEDLVKKGVPVKAALAISKQAMTQTRENRDVKEVGEEILALRVQNRNTVISQLVIENKAAEKTMLKEMTKTETQTKEQAQDQLQKMTQTQEQLEEMNQTMTQDKEKLKGR